MPKISVITSVYNTKVEYLQDYIDSIMEQTYQDFEGVIVDDGSSNLETIEFLKEIHTRYNGKVSVFFQECNNGIAASRNYGMDKANGEYICFIDSDDYYESDFLERMVNPIEHNSSIDMVICSGYTCVGEKKNLLKVNSFKGKTIDDFFYFRMPTGTRLIKREMLVDNHIKFPIGTIYEDNAFCMTATLYSSKIAYVESHGYVNRQHGASYSHGKLYKTITLDHIPYEYIEKYMFTKRIWDNVNPEKRMVAQGAVMNMIATCVCLFCRKSEEEQIDNIINYSSKFIKKHVRNSYKCILLWCKNSDYGFVEKMLNQGYGLAVNMRCEKMYVNIIHKILNMVND